MDEASDKILEIPLTNYDDFLEEERIELRPIVINVHPRI